MPQSIPKGIIREHVLKALAELDSGMTHPFGEPTAYDLFHDGKSYAPKAVIGLAFRHLSGRLLLPEEFSGGNSAGQANYILRQLGFTVVRMADDWSDSEVRLIVDDYFEMLQAELLGEPYNKTAHRRLLSPRLDRRSDASIEFKHQNISAVLATLGLPYIDGYKPRGNFQALLATAVEHFNAEHPAFFEKLAQARRMNPTDMPVLAIGTIGGLFVPPPEQIIVPRELGEPWLSRKGRQIDFALRDAENRRLGKLGEHFVVAVEKKRLLEAGRDDLAAKVEWVADTCGDGLGYDVLSFNEHDTAEKFVEVKATGLGKFHPFCVSSNEVRCSEAVPEKFHLFRVFNFSTDPRLYVLTGALPKLCQLDPMQYRASIATKR